ncbi:DUF4476 domain-containing protein [uncultured Pontibacter sp.]|uniref:DUF4476 domain-containing protein n=1 Tax=uncultured Pontibacter sp. TaxID=453356 RepID=UPI0026156AE9|nr:DUF4476 domain-containing protein [uncultured Pontibacter sp.]
MKKLLLPLLFVLLALPAFAQPTVVTFTTHRGELFQMALDGRVINRTASNFVRITHLRPGNHYVEFRIRGRHGIYRTGINVLARAGFETNYAVRVSGRKVSLRVISEIPLGPPPVVVVPPPPRYPDRYEPVPPRYEPVPPRYEEPAGACRNLLDRYDVDRLIDAMKGRDFESTRLTIAREAVRNGSILSEDLRNVLLAFEFESTRLEFAKFAYDNVCDKERFYYIYDIFKFDHHVRELEEYTSRRR